MGSRDEVVEIDSLERGLLSSGASQEENGTENEAVLYAASFQDMEENFVKYQTAQWVLYSLLLMLAWGIGLFMLLYLPVRRYILRKDIRSRKLYLTQHAIVYKSLFGVYSLRIENLGVRKRPSDDVLIQGVTDPSAFRKAVVTQLSSMRTEAFSRQISTIQESPNLRMSPSKSTRHDCLGHSGDLLLLQKLEEVGSSVKKVQTLIEEQICQTSES
ncbi:uncharacterized protein LOC110826203 isoform X2 [Carica papaya]|uniref:uncharacterized protein LOC110826203 isoform X2 n=1 Tax=Carica papaya TaxID=3649 RepID=UPI000B8CCCB8|nr:uncharacterized protein LOC110826203 isoform X2 [Carica papaya]